jgi:hypothetical protein
MNENDILIERVNEISFHLLLSFVRKNNISPENLAMELGEVGNNIRIKPKEKEEYLKILCETL